VERHLTGIVGHIENIVVHKNYQSKGFGKTIMHTLHKIAFDAEKTSHLHLFCKDKNVKFYEKLGYYTAGEELFARSKL
jgi:glucosamine-phosphate N-acetyltransferase